MVDFRRLAQNARSGWRARQRMELTGLTPNGHLLWAEWEAGNLVGGYPDYNSVMTLNVRRTRPAHHGKAVRLRITRPRAPEWQPQEIATVRRMFARDSREAIMAAVPSRSWSSICRRGWAMGLRRPRRPYCASGIVLIDQIHERLLAKGLTLADLDVFVGRRDYFQRRRWKGRGRSQAVHFSAVEALGGIVRARPADHGKSK